MSLRARFESKFIVTPGCWIWVAALNSSGYGHFRVKTGESMRSAHRVSYELYVGELADHLHVLHRCDNRRCVNPDHLRSGTHQENMRERKERGRSAPKTGELNGRARLRIADVQKIRDLISTKSMLQKDIAAMYGISRETVRNITIRKLWSHI